MEEKTKSMQDKVIEKVEEAICTIADEGIQPDNLDNLGKLVDIHKDIKHEEYMKIKEENIMRYRNYGEGNYGYGYGDSYGRRGVKGTGRGRYRGEELMDEMYGAYGEYSESKGEYNASGSYGAKQDTMKSLEYMMESVVAFIGMLQKEAESPEEIEIIRKYSKKISEM